MPAQGESPAVARRRVRLALKRAREALGLSQTAVARKMDWSLAKVQRIEAGDNAVSGTDLRALLDLYQVTDEEEIEQLQEEARVSRRQRWWAKGDVREHVTPGLLQLLQFEAESTMIRTYQPVLVPGVLQTPDYANFLIGWYNKSLTEEDRRVRFEVRMQRQRQLLEAEDGPMFLAIMDESFLKREIGGARIMADQLDKLVELNRHPRVQVRIVPYREGALLGLMGQFSLLDLGDDDPDDAVLYRETFLSDALDHNAGQIKYHRRMFEALWLRSLDEEQTNRQIVAEAAALRAGLDRL